VVQVLCGLIASVSVTVAGKDHTMSRRRHTPEQVIRKLAEGQKLLAGGMTVEEVCPQFGIAESTWARWLSQCPVSRSWQGFRLGWRSPGLTDTDTEATLVVSGRSPDACTSSAGVPSASC
jgi:transposase-like protein